MFSQDRVGENPSGNSGFSYSNDPVPPSFEGHASGVEGDRVLEYWETSMS